MKTVEFQGGKVAYKVHGKGNNIVLLHGFCEDSTVWGNFQTDLVEENYRVLTIDLPGFGQSSCLESPSIAAMAEAVNTVIDTLIFFPFVLIGHSMGGYVSLAFAERYPEKLLGLGLFHSHPYADPAATKELRSKGIHFIEQYGHILFVKQLIPKLFFTNYARSNAFLLDKLIYRATKFEPKGITDALKAMRDRSDLSVVLSQISCPVLFIIGKKDGAIPHETSIAQTHLPKTASIHLLDKVAHMGMFEAERATQKIIRDFAVFCINQTK